MITKELTTPIENFQHRAVGLMNFLDVDWSKGSLYKYNVDNSDKVTWISKSNPGIIEVCPLYGNPLTNLEREELRREDIKQQEWLRHSLHTRDLVFNVRGTCSPNAPRPKHKIPNYSHAYDISLGLIKLKALEKDVRANIYHGKISIGVEVTRFIPVMIPNKHREVPKYTGNESFASLFENGIPDEVEEVALVSKKVTKKIKSSEKKIILGNDFSSLKILKKLK